MCMGFLTFINLEAKEVDDDQELKHDFKSRISLSDFRSEKELYLLEDRQIENILRNHNLWNDGYQDRSEPIRSIIWLWKSKFKGKCSKVR